MRETDKLRLWVTEPPPNDVRRSLERLARVDAIDRIAVMPDVHLATDVCVGVVLGSRTHVVPRAIGVDIGCGMLAARFAPAEQMPADATTADEGGDLRRRVEAVGDDILAAFRVAVPVRRQRAARMDDPRLTRHAAALRDDPLSDTALDHLRTGAARAQLGTLGTGNHFVELQVDDDDRLWVMIHSGSRGVGRAIARRYADSGADGIDARTTRGRAFVVDATWATRFAAANRRAMLASVADVLERTIGARLVASSIVDQPHNVVRRESIDGVALWVHRKGALPAAAGERGMIPGSMATESFHVVGRGHAAAMHSASHGAGRVGSRAEARRRISVPAFRRAMKGVAFDARRAAALVEEAPMAYRDIRRVMRAQRELVAIERRLRPVLSYKGA